MLKRVDVHTYATWIEVGTEPGMPVRKFRMSPLGIRRAVRFRDKINKAVAAASEDTDA